MKRSIHNKVFLAILITSLTFGGLVFVTAMSEFLSQKKSVELENRQLFESLTSETLDQFVQLNRQMAQALTKMYGDTINENFRSVRETGQSVAAYMEILYKAESWDAQSDQMVGYMPGADPKALREEFLKVKGIRDYIRSLSSYDPNRLDIMDIYVVTESGMCLDGTGKEYEGLYTELRTASWYNGAKEKGKPYWAKTFVGAATGIKKITCAVPFYNEKGEFSGAAAVDLAVGPIYNTALATRSDQVRHALLLDGEGNVVVNPDGFELPASGVREGVYLEEDGILSYIKIPETDWTLCLEFQMNQMTEAAESVENVIRQSGGQMTGILNKSINRSVLSFLAVILAGSAAVFFISGRLTRGIVSPLKQLSEKVKEMGGGNLDVRIDQIHTGDEMEVLADSCNHMAGELKAYIKNLAAVTADRERIETELNVASQIQSGMLPRIFPAFPDREEFVVYASMNPAKEVGGDFYDFFLTDENHLAVVIADVSGKGVPAALFMVIAKTLIKNHAQAGELPSEIFAGVNAQLAEENEALMFVTAWLGILDIRTGRMAYASAGHNPPLLRKAGGSFQYLEDEPGFVLAAMEGIVYTDRELYLEPGDQLYLYTDGVTEATDSRDELYGEERLREKLDKIWALPPEEILEAVREDMDLFVKGAPQFDDITMLILKICNH